MTATLTAIHIHPVKSCRAVEVETAEVVATGLRGDRTFQVVDPDGAPVTQRQHPVLATVTPTVLEGGLRLEADGRRPLEVSTPTESDTTARSLPGVPVEAGDAGDEAAAWFAELLGTPVRLVAMTSESGYPFPLPGIDMRLTWVDGGSVLIVNAASLRWLVERASEPFGMDRFRPNLTVDTEEPWVEDTWRDVSVGAARFGLGLAWPRCAIPQIDQVDASRHREPARVLRAHRWCSDASAVGEALRPVLEGSALFGIACSVVGAGVSIAVGDPVTVHDTADPIIPAPD